MDSGTAYFPVDDGSFNLKGSGVQYFHDLIVEEPSVTIPCYNRLSQSPLGPATMTTFSGIGVPSLPSITRGAAGGTLALKITKAMCNAVPQKGKEFQPITQIYVDINEQCANVTYIKSNIKKMGK